MIRPVLEKERKHLRLLLRVRTIHECMFQVQAAKIWKSSYGGPEEQMTQRIQKITMIKNTKQIIKTTRNLEIKTHFQKPKHNSKKTK